MEGKSKCCGADWTVNGDGFRVCLQCDRVCLLAEPEPPKEQEVREKPCENVAELTEILSIFDCSNGTEKDMDEAIRAINAVFTKEPPKEQDKMVSIHVPDRPPYEPPKQDADMEEEMELANIFMTQVGGCDAMQVITTKIMDYYKKKHAQKSLQVLEIEINAIKRFANYLDSKEYYTIREMEYLYKMIGQWEKELIGG